jgi:alcohol dehydrogenase
MPSTNLVKLDHKPFTTLVFGDNSLDQLGALAAGVAKGRALLVTDAGVRSTGHVDRAAKSLRDSGFEVEIFDRVIENPTTREVEACVAVAGEFKPALIVGLGGGSSMDTAKGCNFIHTNGGQMQDYWGVGKATREMLPMIAIPTTAGTGSECQSFALIADPETHRKMACGDPKAAAKISILDPVLTLTQPTQVTAATGIDAIAHSLESAVTKGRNEISSHFSSQAFKRVINALPEIFKNPDNLDARREMQTGAAYAGVAIENSMLGAAHASANPLTARMGITHGLAVGMMLPAVVRYNSADPEVGKIYHCLAMEAGLIKPGDDQAAAIEAIENRLGDILRQVKIPFDVVRSQLDGSMVGDLAGDASKEWTGTFNPREMSVAGFAELYHDTFQKGDEK